MPQDWAGNPNLIFFYHCPDNAETRAAGHRIINPGDQHVWCPAPQASGSLAASLADALLFAGLADGRSLAILLHLGESYSLSAGEELPIGACSPASYGVVLAGCLTPTHPSREAEQTILRAGDVFGTHFAYDIVPGSYRAASPATLLVWPAQVLAQLLRERGGEAAAAKQKQFRRLLDRSRIFRNIPAARKNALCNFATYHTANAKDVFLSTETPSSSLFLSVAGGWKATQKNWPRPVSVPALGYPFFNEAQLFCSEDQARDLDLRVTPTTTRASCLEVKGSAIVDLASRFAGVKLELRSAINLRLGLGAGPGADG
ncbi:MAG: hypothetical protein EOO40_07220 [Deltaproteobacteria bacterium]|nr:MAG: hypothetical protein EOO40_07220 [Deltaproteobacteria bacterium]